MRKLSGGRARAAVAALVVVAAVIGAAVAGMVAQAGTRTTRVTITEREYRLTLSRKSVPAGKVTFVIVDRGMLSHSLAIKGAGASRRLSGTVHPGRTRKLTVVLKAGKLSMWCPVTGHAALGMKAVLKVKGSASAGSTSTGTTSGSGGGGWG
jgi:plastocyanin